MSKRVILLTLLFTFGSGNAFCQNNSAPANDTGIQTLGHVAMGVSDIDTAMHFYCDQLGFTEVFRINRPTGSLFLVYLRVNNTTFVELLPGMEKSSEDVNKRTGPQHIGFWVSDLQAMLHTLQARGYPLPDDAFKKAAVAKADGSYAYFLKDPDGNTLEMQQMLPDSKEAKSQR